MNNMDLKKRIYAKAGGAVLLLAGAPLVFGAQSVLMNSPSQSQSDTATRYSEEESTNNEMQVFIPATDAQRASDQPFKYEPFVFRPHFDYSFDYGTGIQSGTNSPQSSIIQTISPGMSVDLGKHWTVDYTPSLTYYSNKKFIDTLNHSATLNGATSYEDWTFGLAQTFVESSSPLAETASQTKTTDYNTALTATYAFNDHVTADLNVNQDFNYVSALEDSKTWSTMDWLNYSFWTRLTVGAGLGGGYVDLKSEGDQTFQQLQGRLSWRATDKFSLGLTGGLEDQQYDTPGVSASLTPIFTASVQYQPFDHTQLSLSASRSTGSSDYFIIASTETTTGVTLNFNQRLLEKYNLNLSAGYTDIQYTESVGVLGSSSRRDNSYDFSARLSHSFLKRGTIALTYSYTDYQSTAIGFSYNSNQVGVEVQYSY